jgi:autotransporter-associated beta strand protein
LGGEGIVNNSSVEQRFDAWPFFGNTIEFRNSASAGKAHFKAHSGALIAFYDTATAGAATFDNTPAGVHGFNGGDTLFFGSSTAGNATINNYAGIGNGAATLFMDTSRAGTATVVSQGVGPQGNSGVQFRNRSSGDHATLIATGGNLVAFEDKSVADSATAIANGGTTSGALGGLIIMTDRSNAENAVLMANSGSNGGNGGQIAFLSESQGGNAQVELASGALLEIDGHSAPGVSLGSVDGAGQVILGANNLTIGADNLSTIVSGLIEDGTFGKGGSLTKLGSGALELTGANTYTGGTIVTDGTLSVRNTTGSATGTGAVLVEAGSLSGDGIIAGSVIVGIGDRDVTTATISPGVSAISPGIMTVQSNVALNSDAAYQFNLQSDTGTAAAMSASGVTIDANALFTAQDTGSSMLPVGTSFVVISNTSADPISGTFANLADGGTITSGNNTFQANYEGGDGNDLTLTVVP